ncbi:MAG: Mov34/MPN/PAD-1 family protein [bacterium]|nr:Mov34/MPN/PAD-1 family protein [bacterium]
MKLFRESGSELAEGDRWPALSREIAQIYDQLAVMRNSIRVSRLEDKRIAVSFLLATDELDGPPDTDIRDTEPISFVYSEHGVGLAGPQVYSDRPDFPRNLTHLNPVAEDSPVSICLAREGHATLYERRGVTGFLKRLCRWLLDAKTSSLNMGGWEPIPLPNSTVIGIVQGASFQEYGSDSLSDGSWATFVATVSGSAALFKHETLCRGLSGGVDSFRAASDNADDGSAGGQTALGLFLMQPADRVESNPGFLDCSNGKDLFEQLNAFGLLESFTEAVAAFAINDFSPSRVIVLLGIRRPIPMMSEIFGLSSDPEARAIELRGYSISACPIGRLDTTDSVVENVLLDPQPGSALLADVSGTKPLKPGYLVGYGALGSQLGEMIARAGGHCIGVVDSDLVRSHNLARHAAIIPEIGLAKGLVQSRISRSLNLFESHDVRAVNTDVIGVNPRDLGTGVPSDAVVIDSTASDGVRRALARSRWLPRIARGEIYQQGQLGVQSIESEGRNPDVLDLYYFLCRVAAEDDSVSAALRGELTDPVETGAFAAGFGCASATTRMPQWKVAAHAAAFMPALSQLLAEVDHRSGLGLNELSPSGEPIGWRWLDVDSFDVDPNASGWEVRIAPGVSARMNDLMQQSSPCETGGYLYGGIDPPLRRITVVSACAEPPTTVADTNRLKLPPAGRSEEEKQLRRGSGLRLVPVGSWHSHPAGGSSLSAADRKTAEGFRLENLGMGLPTLLLIVSPDRVGVHVVE